ncbi:MAG TPA: L,D-transpeptidase family protein [Marmoricola sp.]|nr:L,D-transpeptidase family protein [Marmoricola sp.]
MRRTGTIIAGAVVIVTSVGLGATAYGELGLPGNDRTVPTTDRTGDDPVDRPAVMPTRKPPAQQVERPVEVEKKPKPTPPPVPEAGPPLLSPGDSGPAVREIQARLRQIAWFYGDVTDFYGDQTQAAIEGFQAKRGFEVTGVVDQRTLTRLEEMTVEPTADELNNVEPDPADGSPLDPRCDTGRVLCIDKTSSSLRWVVDGEVQVTLDARFGGNGYVTREGSFSVYRKSRDHVSSLYDSSMPFAMFFDGGQAVHYSPDFAATGYTGASHGCVNIRDYDEIAALYDEVQLGDRVVVYWS